MFKLNQKVIVDAGKPTEVRGRAVGFGHCLSGSDTYLFKPMVLVLLQPGDQGFLSTESGHLAGFVTVLAVHPDNLTAE